MMSIRLCALYYDGGRVPWDWFWPVFGSGLVLPLLISSLTFAGQASLGPTIVQQTQQVVNDSHQGGEKKREEFIQYLQSQLDEFDVKLEGLKSQSEELREKAKTELLERLHQLQARKEELLPQIETAARSSEAAWEDIKDGLKRATAELRTSLEQAASHFF